MKAAPYSDWMGGVADLLGWDPENLDAAEFGTIRRSLSRALKEAWELCFWPDLCRTEQRTFHADYNAEETVVAGVVRYFPPVGEYYLALRDGTGNAPAILDGGEWSTNLDYWTLAEREWLADAWSATEQYAQADVVYFTEDFQHYVAHTDPPLGTEPTDTDYWGVVEGLNPVVPWTGAGLLPIGKVEGVYDIDPRVHRGAVSGPWDETENGVQIRSDLNQPWIRYRRRMPRLVGSAWDADATYEQVSDEDAVTPSAVLISSDYPYFATVGQAEAATISGRRVDVGADANTPPQSATFVRDASFTGDLDGIQGFEDAAATRFRRLERY